MDNTTKLSHYMELSLLKEALDCGILNSDSVLDMLMSSKKEQIKKMIEIALSQLAYSYTPYSDFKVGAALLGKNGRIYTGCNIENAAYTPTNCAERTAFFKAVSEGKKEFTAIAINGDANDYLYPCGVCRQVMAEFCDPETFQVILVNTPDDFKIFTLEELLPGAFTKQDITKATGKEL